MTFFDGGLLTLLVAFPLLAGSALLLVSDRWWPQARLAAILAAAGELGMGLVVLARFPGGAGFAFVEKHHWVERYGLSYHLGVDGLSLPLVLLTMLLGLLVMAVPFEGPKIARPRFLGALLILEAGLVGVFVSLDLVLFYLFWELVLIPLYFVIGVWGGEGRRAANLKFVIYTLAGSLLMLVGIMLLHRNHLAATGYGSFDYQSLLATPIPVGTQRLAFLFLGLGFAVKTPLFPFHTWLPSAYAEAPTAGSVVMAGAMAKMGTYAFLRFGLPLLPQASREFQPVVASLALAGVLLGALAALHQQDLKRFIAWSSFSHMGIIVLGIFSLAAPGLAGASFQMVSHGLVTAGLFVAAAALERSRGGRSLSVLAGAGRGSPFLASIFVLLALAALGLPGLSSFIGEFLIVSGAFRFSALAGAALVAGAGLGALYVLRMLGRTVFAAGGGNEPPVCLAPGEIAGLAAIGILVVGLGVFPARLLTLVGPPLEEILRLVGGH